MLELLKSFMADIGSGEKHVALFGESDYRLAAAALLIHVVGIDGNVSEAESEKLRAVLKSQFDLDDAAVTELIEAATMADRASVDLYRFTSLINRSMDENGRARMVEMMWEMVYADGQVTEFEDNVIWRAADLLSVPSRQRIELRRKVAAAAGRPEDDA
jgi:uncharacterized tellurite resistance protein B-like protein